MLQKSAWRTTLGIASWSARIGGIHTPVSREIYGKKEVDKIPWNAYRGRCKDVTLNSADSCKRFRTWRVLWAFSAKRMGWWRPTKLTNRMSGWVCDRLRQGPQSGLVCRPQSRKKLGATTLRRIVGGNTSRRMACNFRKAEMIYHSLYIIKIINRMSGWVCDRWQQGPQRESVCCPQSRTKWVILPF